MTVFDRVGEVIEASSTQFTAQCYELYRIPPLGSLVKTGVDELEVYGVVYNAATTSLEPGRRAIARGRDETTEADIYRTSPQLLKLLKSEFAVLVVGHKEGDNINHYLPPAPAKIHGFVYQCPPEEVRAFAQSLGFLNILLSAHLDVPADELVAAVLRQMSQHFDDERLFLVNAGRELARQFAGNLGQLDAILGRIRP